MQTAPGTAAARSDSSREGCNHIPTTATSYNSSGRGCKRFLTRGDSTYSVNRQRPTAEDKWISRQIATCEEGGYKDAQTGEPLNREDKAGYELYQQRFSERYRVGEQADRLVQIVDRYMPRIADENRAYVMHYPDKVGEMLQKAWKLRKKIRKRQREEQLRGQCCRVGEGMPVVRKTHRPTGGEMTTTVTAKSRSQQRGKRKTSQKTNGHGDPRAGPQTGGKLQGTWHKDPTNLWGSRRNGATGWGH